MIPPNTSSPCENAEKRRGASSRWLRTGQMPETNIARWSMVTVLPIHLPGHVGIC
jgi:hypothetical protein